VSDEKIRVGALKNNDSNVTICLELLANPIHLFHHFQIQEVNWRMINGDKRDSMIDFYFKTFVVFVGHIFFPPIGLNLLNAQPNDRNSHPFGDFK
jgi:hypothetical protein